MNHACTQAFAFSLQPSFNQKKEKTNAMRAVFEMLDEKCQKILHYYLFEKRSMREISQLMGYSSEDVGLDIAVDSTGNAYVTGYTYATDFPLHDR